LSGHSQGCACADDEARAEEARAEARADEARAEARADVETARQHEFRKAALTQPNVSSSNALTPTEFYELNKPTHWQVQAKREEFVGAHKSYTTAYESAVQTEMIAALKEIASSCGLECFDAHARGVSGLHKPDAVFTPLHFFVASAAAVAFLAEFKARSSIADDGQLFAFTSSLQGQVMDKLSRLRVVRPGEDLFATLSNGYHYQLFKLDAQGGVHASDVFLFSDVGALKAVMRLAAASMAPKFWFQSLLQKEDLFKHMSVRSLLGAGAQCRAWEFGDESLQSVAVVVAETAGACRHLMQSYRVFADLAGKISEMPKPPPLYTPLFRWSAYDCQKAVCVFAQAGTRWSSDMYRANLLTRQDVHDIVDQIKLFHDHGYIHCDVALRNCVQYEDNDNGTFRSVLIDAGAAVKEGERWCGGTVNNAAISWLEANLEKAVRVEANKRVDDIAVPTKKEELWSFVFAEMDLFSWHRADQT
jgi:hypothetical protein